MKQLFDKIRKVFATTDCRISLFFDKTDWWNSESFAVNDSKSHNIFGTETKFANFFSTSDWKNSHIFSATDWWNSEYVSQLIDEVPTYFSQQIGENRIFFSSWAIDNFCNFFMIDEIRVLSSITDWRNFSWPIKEIYNSFGRHICEIRGFFSRNDYRYSQFFPTHWQTL